MAKGASGGSMTDRGTSQGCVTDHPNPPAWRQLANPEITDPERILLFTTTFSDSNAVRNLSPDEAQPFIDAVHEVSPQVSSLQEQGLINLQLPGPVG